jgi:hypothetical protein
MVRKRKVTLEKYEVVATKDVYYGYPAKDAVIKEIDGDQYIEVIDSIVHPKVSYIKLNNLSRIGDITFDVEV